MPATSNTSFEAALNHHRSGRLDRAESLYREIVRVDPGHADALHLLGVAAYQRNQNDRAIDFIRRAIAINGSAAPFHSNLGASYRALGRLDEAVSSYQEAIRLAPEFADPHYNLGNVLKDLLRFEEAIASYRSALDLKPDMAEAHNNLGDALKCAHRLDEAIASHRRAVEIKPELQEAHFNLGNAFKQRGDLNRAIVSYRRALEIKPDYTDAHINLGYCQEDQGDLSVAVVSYERAIAIDGNCAEAHFNRALAWIRAGDLARGWPEYEWRFERKVRRRCLPQPPWKGDSLSGRTILLYAEQGIGDEIMFASCIGDVLRQASGCLIECDPRLVQLFSRSFAPAEVVARADDPQSARVAADVQCAFGSLPRYLRSSLESFPAGEAFLEADPQLVEEWQRRFDKVPAGLKVGISWQGGKEADVRRKRSTRLDQWEQLLGVQGVTFVNLQYGDVAEQLQAVPQQRPVTIHHWPAVDPLKDLDGFAAQITALDLVVSVDNSTVHMAGALGVPVWTLLPFASDWRWFLEGTGSPWYQSMRLFRQRTAGDWEELFDRVVSALEQTVAEARSGDPTAVDRAELIEPEC